MMLLNASSKSAHDLCFTVALSTVCLFIFLLQCVCDFTLCSIISSTLPPPSTASELATHISHLAIQLLSISSNDVWISGSKHNLIDFDGLKVVHFCRTDIYSIRPNQCNVPIAICFCHLELLHPK